MATPSHVDLSVLWVPIMPETSKIGPAMEQAGKDAKTKFDKSVKDIGKSINDDLDKVGTQVGTTMEKAGKEGKGRFQNAVKDLGKTIHDDLDKIGDRARDGFSKVGERAKDSLRSAGKLAADAFNTEFGRELQASAGDFGAAFSDLKSGNVTSALDHAKDALDGMDDAAKRVGVDLSGWTGPLEGVTEPLMQARDTSNDLAQHLTDAKGGIDRLAQSGGGLSGLIGKLGEVGTVAAAVAAALDSIKDADHWLEQKMPWYRKMDEDWKNNPVNSFFHNMFGGDDKSTGPTATTDADGNPLSISGVTAPQTPGSGPQFPSNFVGPIPPGATRTLPPTQAPGNPNYYKDLYGSGANTDSEPPPSTSQFSVPRSSGGGGGGGGSRPGAGLRTPSVSSRADLHSAGSRVANLYAFAESLVGTPYSQALRNDCSGMVSQLAAVALGLEPPSPSQRFSTVNEGDWLFSHGFRPGIGPPGSFRVGWYDHGGGNNGHTAVTLPGGEHAESGGSHGSFLVGPGAAGADNPEFEHHAWLPMDGSSSGPLGSKSDPLYVSSADGDKDSGGSGPWESQGQQLGQGLVNGIAEMFGLDGSVFKGFGSGKGLLDFGALKLGGGALSWGMHMLQARNAAGGAGAAMGSPADAGGGGISLPGMGMIPSIPLGPGPAVSAGAVPTDAPAGAPSMGPGNTVHVHGDVNPVTVNQTGVPDGPAAWQQYNIGTSANRYRTQMAALPKVAMA